ncbi:MAG TPA: hypothetical protein VMH39_05610, partial [Gemmatimonadaceae bacterium]|nr:hypothetical protein [Gemmatimonadaceae bacterium]
GGLGPHPQVFNTNLDAKLQLPGLTHLFGYAPRFTVYAIGGASNSYYHNLRVEANPGQGTVGPLNAMPLDANWTSHWGYNVGGGVSFHWRETELFAESRVIAFNMANAPTARQIPIMFGVDWY